MKIQSVQSIHLNLPYCAAGGARLVAGQASPGLAMVLVRVETDTGLVGWGEAFGHAAAAASKAAIDTMVGPALIGCEVVNPDAIQRRLFRRFHQYGHGGPVAYAISGIDIALWDIAGKIAGKPVYQLLGGTQNGTVTVYSSFQRCLNTASVAEACRAALAQGYRHVKLHETTVDAVRTARETLGPNVGLTLDANCPWTVAEAAEIAGNFAPFDLDWIEEPIYPPDDFEGLAALRKAGVVVAAGENAASLREFRTMFEAGAVDVVQPSVTKVGGISEIRKITELAAGHGIRVVPHCGFLGPGYLATLHIIAAMPDDVMLERLNMSLHANPFPGQNEATGGRERIPAEPGLVGKPDLEILEAFLVR